MLEDAAKIRRVIVACGYVDLRKGIDGLATMTVTAALSCGMGISA